MTSRLAGVPREQPAPIHGAAVWAVSTLVLAWLAMSGAGATFGAAGTILSNYAQAAVSAARAVLPEHVSLPSPGQVASGMSMEDLPPEAHSALQERGLTIEEVRAEARGALRDVVGRQEQQEVQETAAGAIRSPGDLPQDANRLIDDLFGGQGAVLSEEDRQEALTTLEQRLGISPEGAEAFLASAEERAEEAAAQIKQSVEAARRRATEAAQTAVSRAALALSVASILGLAAALVGGHVGRPHDLSGDRPSDRA